MNVAAQEQPKKVRTKPGANPRKKNVQPRPIAAANILELLKTKHLSAAELAKYCQLHRSYMSRMLNGENPLTPYLPKISEFLSVSVEQLERNGPAALATEQSFMPWGPLDSDGRSEVPSGCIIMRLDMRIDAPKHIGRYVMLSPTKQKPKSGELVYCSTMSGDVYVRVYTHNAADRQIFMLQPNSPSDSIVAVNVASVHELRVVALRNLFSRE